jgi:hypothetical protein
LALFAKWVLSYFSLPPAISLCLGAGFCAASIAIAVFKRPSLAGRGDHNLLIHLPERLKKNRWIKQTIDRI